MFITSAPIPADSSAARSAFGKGAISGPMPQKITSTDPASASNAAPSSSPPQRSALVALYGALNTSAEFGAALAAAEAGTASSAAATPTPAGLGAYFTFGARVRPMRREDVEPLAALEKDVFGEDAFSTRQLRYLPGTQFSKDFFGQAQAFLF